MNPSLDAGILQQLAELGPGQAYLTLPDGRTVQRQYSQAQGMDGVDGPTEGYIVYDYSPSGNEAGETYSQYGTDGAYQQEGEFKDVNFGKDFMTWLATAAAMAGGANMLGIGGAGSAGAAGIAGPGEAGWGMDLGTGMTGEAYVPWEAGFEGTGAISGPDAIAGAGTVGGAASPLAATAGAGSGLSLPSLSTLSSASKILGAVSALGGKSGGSGSGSDAGPAAPRYFDEGYEWKPPGWRTDRPTYRPGVDQIPEGWNKPGGNRTA